MDILAELYDELENCVELDNALTIANHQFETNYVQGKIKLSESVAKKCRESGCWLFVYKGDTLIRKIVDLIIMT